MTSHKEYYAMYDCKCRSCEHYGALACAGPFATETDRDEYLRKTFLSARILDPHIRRHLRLTSATVPKHAQRRR